MEGGICVYLRPALCRCCPGAFGAGLTTICVADQKNGYMLGGSEPFMMIRTRSSGWCWIILEFETGLAESQCHVMCELHYRYNQVEQTDLAINPIPIPPLLRQLQLHMATRVPDLTPEHHMRAIERSSFHLLLVPNPNPTPSTAVQRGRPVAGSSSPSWHLLLGRATVCSGQGKAASLTPRP